MTTTTPSAVPSAAASRLPDAAREFWRHPSPWMIGAGLVATLTRPHRRRRLAAHRRCSSRGDARRCSRSSSGVVHVFVLHWRPRRLGRLTIDSLLARKHREHHVDPREVPLIFIPWPRAAVGAAGVGRDRGARLPAHRTRADLSGVRHELGLGYEWCHYLIHSDYKPKTAAIPGDLDESPAASLQERALLVHRDERRHGRPRARHLSGRGDRRGLTDGEEPARSYACTMIGSPMLTVS